MRYLVTYEVKSLVTIPVEVNSKDEVIEKVMRYNPSQLVTGSYGSIKSIEKDKTPTEYVRTAMKMFDHARKHTFSGQHYEEVPDGMDPEKLCDIISYYFIDYLLESPGIDEEGDIDLLIGGKYCDYMQFDTYEEWCDALYEEYGEVGTMEEYAIWNADYEKMIDYLDILRREIRY